MQEVILKTPYIHSHLLSTWPSIRHLDLETHIPDLLQHVNMRVFTQLETLRLCSWGLIPASINSIDLNLSQLHRLRRLRVENWSPRSINVIPGCQVHVKWKKPQAHPPVSESTPPWVSCPVWIASSSSLVSFDMVADSALSAPVSVHALHGIMECHERLESLRLVVKDVGSRIMPLTFPAPLLEGLRAPLTVDIAISGGCWLQLNDKTPFSDKLVLRTKGPVHIGIPAAQGAMLWHHLEGASASSVGEGAESLWGQLAEAIPEVQNVNPEDDGAPGQWYQAFKKYGVHVLIHGPPMALLSCAIVSLKCVCG